MNKGRKTMPGPVTPRSKTPSTNAHDRSPLRSGHSNSNRTASQRRHSTRRSVFAAAGAVVLAGAISLSFFHTSSITGYHTSSRAWLLPRLGSAGKVSLSSFKGRPVIVNFFASWCTVCAGELPVFTSAADALKGKIDVVEVNALETGNGASFARQYQLAAHVTAVASDVGGSQGDGLYQSLGGTGTMPMTAFYDATGHLITTHVGGFDSATLAGAVRQLYGISLPA